MDAVEEDRLRAAGARIVPATREEWKNLLAHYPFLEVLRAVSIMRLKCDGAVLIDDALKGLRTLGQKPSEAPQQKSSSATAAQPAAAPEPAKPVDDNSSSAPKVVQLQDGLDDGPLLTEDRSRSGRAARYLREICACPGITQAELARRTNRNQNSVKLWLAANAELVEISFANGKTIRLSPKGKASAAALGIELKPEVPPRETPIVDGSHALAPRLVEERARVPDQASAVVDGQVPSAPVPAATEAAQEPEPEVALPPVALQADRPATGTPAPSKDELMLARERALWLIQHGFDSRQKIRDHVWYESLEADLVRIIAGHIYRRGYTRTMSDFCNARYLFGLG